MVSPNHRKTTPMGDISESSVKEDMTIAFDWSRIVPPPTFHPSYNPTTYPDADGVLISKDDIYFSVHISIFRLSSAFFRDMFPLDHSGVSRPRCSTISLSEESDVVATILDIVYPDKALPNIPCVTLFHDIAVALEKFNMQGALQTLSDYVMVLKSRYPTSYTPIPLYAIARRYKWAEVQQAASESSLASCIETAASYESLGDAIRCIDTYSLVIFRDWHEKRKKIVLDSIEDLKLFLFSKAKTDTCHENFHWSYIHATKTFHDCDPPLICQIESEITQQRQSWNSAIEKFQIRLRYALDKLADCVIVQSDEFWCGEPWEFSPFKCSACHSDIIDKKRLRETLALLISRLPKSPGDKEPVKMCRAVLENSTKVSTESISLSLSTCTSTAPVPEIIGEAASIPPSPASARSIFFC